MSDLIIFEQFKSIRDIGNVNMLDMNGVMVEANEYEFYDLVSYLADIQMIRVQSERSKKYMQFLHDFSDQATE